MFYRYKCERGVSIMLENNSNLGSNIRTLRKYNKERQKDFADILHVTLDTVSKYERSKRTPNEEILDLISTHYNIPLYSLLNDSITYEYLDSRSKAIDKPLLELLAKSIYIETSSPKARTNHTFSNGCDYLNCFFESPTSNLFFIQKSKSLFYESYKESKLIAGAANTLLSIMFEYFKQLLPNMYTSSNGKNISINYESFESAAIAIKNGDENKRNAFIQKNEEIYDDCLYALKNNPSTYALADFYLAIKYILGIVNNDNDFDTNSNIGMTMMYEFSNLNNKYAKRLIDTMEKIFLI